MSKTKTILKNLLGAAFLTALASQAAFAAWYSGPNGGNLITSDVLNSPCPGGGEWCNKVEFLPGPGGDVYVVWSRDNDLFQGQKYDIRAQRLSATSGDNVWGSTITLMSQVPQGIKTADWNYFGPEISTGGISLLYADDSSSRAYVAAFNNVGNTLWASAQLNSSFDYVDFFTPKVPRTGSSAYVLYSTSSADGAEGSQGFVQVVNMTTSGMLGGNGTGVFNLSPGTMYLANGAASPAGGGQASDGAIFVVKVIGEAGLRAFRVDNTGAVNWSVSYSTLTANIPDNRRDSFFVLPDGASGVYVAWADAGTQDIVGVRIAANGVQYETWPVTIDTNMYLNATYGGSGDTGAFYAHAVSNGLVVAWAEDAGGNASIRAALIPPAGTAPEWTKLLDTLNGPSLSLDGDDLKISTSSAGNIALAYQYTGTTVQKAVNAVVVNGSGAKLYGPQLLMSGFVASTPNHDPFVVESSTGFVVGVVISSGVYAQRVDFSGVVLSTFTGDFSSPGGANFDGGAMDGGWATAYYGGSVYVAGGYAPVGGILVRYNSSGVMLSSATLPGVEFAGVAVNAAGVYAVGSSATRMVVAKFNGTSLAFISSKTVEGSGNPSSGADIALCAGGNAYVVGTDHSVKSIMLGMYDPNLALLSETSFETSGDDTGSGITVDGTDVYAAGHSLLGGATSFVTLKYSLSDYLSVLYASSSLSGIYLDAEHPVGGKLEANPLTHQVYAAVNQSNKDMVLARYNQFLVKQDTVVFHSDNFAAASDLVLDSTGSVLLAGSYNTGGSDYPVLVKYSPLLVFQSSAAVAHTYGYEGIGLSFDPVAGYSYITGVYFANGSTTQDGWDMRTVKFGPLGDAAVAEFEGSNSFDMINDGAGGAYMVYDSTVAADGQRKVYVRRVSGAGAPLWTYEASSAFYTGENEDDVFAGPDGFGGLLAAWTQDGTPYAQRYNAAGVEQWTAGGLQISSAPALGVKFEKTGDHGVAALILYPDGAGFLTALQKMDNAGACQWPAVGPCSAAAGVTIPFADMEGEVALAEGAAGSLWALWSADNGSGRLEVNGARVAAGGTFAVAPKVLAMDASFNLGKSLAALDDSAGGLYSVWASSESTLLKLHAQRFDADGNSVAGWSFPLQLTGYIVNNYVDVELAKDPEGFAVMYSTMGWNNTASEVRVVRASATINELAPGWTTGGLLLGQTIDGPGGIVYDGSAYHMNWNQTAMLGPGNFHRVDYQRMNTDGQFAFDPAYVTGFSSNCLNMAISTNGAGGALSAWMEDSGGTVLPQLVNISSSMGAFPVNPFSGDFAQPTGAVYDGGAADWSQALAIDTVTAGGPYIYTAGESSYTVTGIGYPVVIKYGPTGAKLAHDLVVGGSAGSFESLKVLPDGSVIAAGHANGQLILRKYDTSFNLVASTGVPGNDAWDMDYDATGNIYLVGGQGNFSDGWLMKKFNPGLDTVLASQTFDTSDQGDLATGVAVRSDGSVLVTGVENQGALSQWHMRVYDSEFSVLYSSASYAVNTSTDSSETPELAYSPTGEFYISGAYDNGTITDGKIVRFSSGLAPTASAVMGAGEFGAYIKPYLDDSGNVIVPALKVGMGNEMYVQKFGPALTAVSSVSVSYLGMGAVADASGYVYVSGVEDLMDSQNALNNIHTTRHTLAAGAPVLPQGSFYNDFSNGATGAVYENVNGIEGDNLAVDNANGFVYVVGHASNPATGLNDGFVVKYNLAGAKISSATISEPGRNFTAEAVKVATDGSVFVTGDARFGALADYSLTIKYDTSLLVVTSYTNAGNNLTMALANTGHVVVGGFGFDGGYPVWQVRSFNPLLSPMGLASFPAASNSTGSVQGLYGAADGAIYASGNQYNSATNTYDWVVRKFADAMSLGVVVSSATYAAGVAPGFLHQHNLGHISVLANAAGHVYVVGPSSGPAGLDYLLRKYDTNLSYLGSQVSFGTPQHDEPLSAAFDLAGNLLVSGWSFDDAGAYTGAAFVEYTPQFTFVSSGAVLGVAVEAAAASNDAFLLGVGENSVNTYKLPLQPTVFISSADISPAQYTAGLESAALKIMPFTIVGTAPFNGLAVQVNPAGEPSDIAALGFYADTNGNGLWDAGTDLLVSSGVPTEATFYFDFAGLDGEINTLGEPAFVTLTPAQAAAGRSVNVGIGHSSALVLAGAIMAEQPALYPAVSAPKQVQIPGSFSGDFTQVSGAVYDGGDEDWGLGVAVDTFTAGGPYIYAVSASSGPERGMVTRYNSSGVFLSSAVYLNSGFMDVAVNPAGVYVTAQELGAGFLTLKYQHDLSAWTSSAAVAGSDSNTDLALDSAGNVYVVGTDFVSQSEADYKLVKYNAALAQQGTVAVFSAGGYDKGRAVAVDNGYVFVAGTSLQGAATTYVTAKFNAATLAFVSSASFAGAYDEDLPRIGLAANPATHDVYLAGSEGTEMDRHLVTVRYSQALNQLGSASFPGGMSGLGFDAAVASDGYVYALGKDYNGQYDYGFVAKYAPNLVFISSASILPADMDSFAPFAMALDPVTGYSYVTGVRDDGVAEDARTVRVAPLGGSLPVVYVSSAAAAPGAYMAGREDGALKLSLYTLAGEIPVTSVTVNVNPAGPYAHVAHVGLYEDSDADGLYTPGTDQLVSSAPVSSAFVSLPLAGLAPISGTATDLVLTLSPSIAAEGANINLAVASSAAFTTDGVMANQAFYPIASPAVAVSYLARITNLATDPGANLDSVTVSWTYPQDLPEGSHYIVRFSTSPAALLSGPNVAASSMVVVDTGLKSAGDFDSAVFALEQVRLDGGSRVLPTYFSAWLYNGTSTSAASNLAQNLSFPVATVNDGDATLRQRRGMMAAYEAGKFARSAAGVVSGVTFDSGSRFVALTAVDGGTHFYNDPADASMALKDLAVDPAGNAYVLLQKSAGVLVAKITPDGAMAWSMGPYAAENAKAVVWGGGAVYLATDLDNAGNQDFHLRSFADSDGTLGRNFYYDSSYLYGEGSYDEVNSLAFTSDASGAFLYAAGMSGNNPPTATLYKFKDTGADISTAAALVPGTWPVRHSNPVGDYSRALVVKTDLNGNLVLTGVEQRYDLNQGLNLWVNRYNAYGSPLFASPARYNNPQGNADDVPAALDFDNYGNIYAAGYTDMWTLGQGANMLLLKFGAGGQLMMSRYYDGGDGSADMASAVLLSTDNYANVAGVFGGSGYYGVYSMPLGAAVNTQFFNAAEGAYTGSVDLMWNYTGRLLPGSTVYVQASPEAAPVWNRASAQFQYYPAAKMPGETDSYRVGALTTLRYPSQDPNVDNRGQLYQFKVWIASGTGISELPAVQSFARTPQAYDNTRYFGRERLSYLSGVSMPPNALTVDGSVVYHAFSGRADGASVGFGLRKYNADQYLEWTKFYNHRLNRVYQVNRVTRDAAGNFYLVGTQFPEGFTGPEILVPGKDIWLAKLNAAGDLVWSYAADASGAGRMDELNDAVVEGNYLYAVGVTSTSADGMAVLAKKFDVTPANAPSELWSYTMNGSGPANANDDYGYGIAVGTGAVYLSATLQNTDKDIVVRALNKDTGASVGALISYDTGGHEEGFDIAVVTEEDGISYAYVAGSTATIGAPSNAALVKHSLNGTLIWDRFYNGKENLDDVAYTVKAASGGVIIAGFEDSDIEGRNTMVRKYTPQGDAPWSRRFNLVDDGDPATVNFGHDEAYGLELGGDGRVYLAVALNENNPGFYYFPEPNFSVTAQPYHVPGSVRLEWMNQMQYLAQGSTFYVQYSTFTSGMVWSSAAAQVALVNDYDLFEGMTVNKVVYGLNNGRDAFGNSLAPLYYFMVWSEPYEGGQLIAAAPPLGGQAAAPARAGEATLVSAVPASARPNDGWAFENIAMYPNDAKLFVMGNSQQYYYGDGEKEFPGMVRDAQGSLYTLANLDWNGNQGFGLKKFASTLGHVWTRYYAPGEWYQAKANRMAVDATGLYITGYERSPGSTTGRDVFVMKVGSGSVLWKTVLDFAGGDDMGYGIALDGSGNVFVAGTFYNGSDNDAFVAKFSPEGVQLSSAGYAGGANGYDAAFAVTVRGLRVYAAGSSEEASKGSQFWLGGYGPNLTQLVTVNGGYDDTSAFLAEAAYDVTVDEQENVYAAGAMYNAETGSLDAAVRKSSANLTALVSTFTYGSQAGGADAVHGLTLDANGAVYAAGYTERYDINQDRNLWLRKYSPDGAELWTQEFHANVLPGETYAMGPTSEQGFNVAVGTLGYVSVSGRFNGYYGLYRYRQTTTLTVNPVLTINVSSGAAGTPFPGVGVTLIPFSPTGGIEVAGSTSSVTNSSGTAAFQVPAGKQYFIALDKQGFSPAIRDQLMDPYGSYFVQMNADLVKAYTLTARPATNPYYPLAVQIASATARDYVMAEVFFTATGEKAGYGIGQVPAGVTATTITITNLPPAAAGAYTLGVTIPARSLAKSEAMRYVFPATATYRVIMSTMAGAIATTGGFDVAGSTTPPTVEGVARNLRTFAPLEQVRIRLWNYNQDCMGGNCDYNVYETLTDVNGKYSFYNVVSTAAPYNLAAIKSGYKRTGYQVGITTAVTSTLFRDFQLEEATYTLRGYLRYRDMPVPNAEVMVWGDYNWYSGTDSYRSGRGMDTDARTKTAADGSFVFSTATANGLPDGQVRISASFFGNWLELNEGNTQDFQNIDADDVRVVISSDSSKWGDNNAQIALAGNCRPGRAWKLNARTGACQSLASGEINFNIMPASQNDYATLSGSVTFVTTYTVTADYPLVISTMAPITVMAMQECEGDCTSRSMGFAVISGTYTVNQATYSITLSTGIAYYTRVTSNEWGEVSSFDDRADFRSTSTLSVRMNFVVTKAGKLTGVVKMPDGSNYRPVEGSHRLDISVNGQNVSVSEGWSVDDYGSFEFPNLAPGLYTLTLRPEGEGFRWAAPYLSNVAVVAGKTTQVTMKLEDGLYVQPQIIGLPEVSTPTWRYMMVPVPSGTEMNQKKITEMFFGDDIFSFGYSTSTQVWEKRIMQVGQYDFYLLLGSRYNPGMGSNEPESYDQFGNFIGKVKGFNVQRNDATPNLGTEAQPIPVNVLGSLGQDTLEGTIAGERLYTDADIERFFSNMNELFQVIPAVMVYDAAGDLRGYTAGLPTQADFPAFWDKLGLKDGVQMRAYFDTHLGRFTVPGMPPGRYTVVFNNPNYPPVVKELDLPLASAYAFDFDEQRIRVGTVYGTVKSTATGEALGNAVVYLKHKTVEKFATTAADGSFSFENMPAGIYRLEVNREGFVKAGEKTSLAGDDSTRLDFWLHPSQTNMTGKVYMSKFPSPVTKSGVKIVAYDETFNVEHPTEYLPKIEATTNDAGEYELAGVVPGHNYKVTAFHGGKQTYTLDVGSETVTEGTTYLPDIVMRDVPPQIVVKVRKSPDSVNKADVTIKSPKMLVTTPVCRINPGEAYVATSAVSLALVPGPNNTYQGQFTISHSQAYYNVYVAAGDGSSRMEKSVTFSPNNAAKTEQYIQDEAIQGGEVQMDKETEEYSGLELDTGGLSYDQSGGASASGYRPAADSGLVGGFFSSLPSVRTVKTAKGDLSLTQAITDLMASEVYNMELQNASANKEFTLTLKYDKDKAADGANLRIYQYDETTGGWNEVPGNYTTDPMLGVLSVGVASLTDATQGTSAAATPYGRKRMGMSAVVNGRYVPSAASTSSSGRFAVFTARPSPSIVYTGADYEVANLPNPFNLKDKTVTNLEGTAAFSGATTYVTRGTLIKYHLPPGKSGSVKFVVYNLAGEKVRTISDGVRSGGGMYYSEWDGRNDNNQDVASGVYFLLTYVDGEKLGAKAHKLAVIK